MYTQYRIKCKGERTVSFTEFFKVLVDFIMKLVSYFKSSDNTEIEEEETTETL